MSSADRAHLLLWLALAVAFSPTLLELTAHIMIEPWARYSIVPLLLLFRAAAADSKVCEPHDVGLWLILGGLALEIFGIVAGPSQVARLGIPPAIIGTSYLLGRPSVTTAMLSLWIVPIPAAVVHSLSPVMNSPVLQGSAALVWPLLPDLVADERTLRWNSELLKVAPTHLGLPLAALLSSIGWFHAARSGKGLLEAVVRATIWGLSAFPLQAGAIALAALTLRWGQAEIGRVWLDHGLWILAATVGILWSERRLRFLRRGV